ncbi:hypothetical protein SynBMKMC1_01045 [Synechococcus sp. BMK-MC-1]|nr:hypothetical protein SynBMKMC1_01045 [Synechococcus sp. BMK-MC-1]
MDAEVRSLSRLERLTDIIYGLSFLSLLLQNDRPDRLSCLIVRPLIAISGSNRHPSEFISPLLFWWVVIGSLVSPWRVASVVLIRPTDGCNSGGLMGVALLPFVNDLLELMPLQASIQLVYGLVLVQIGVFDLLTLLHGWRRPRHCGWRRSFRPSWPLRVIFPRRVAELLRNFCRCWSRGSSRNGCVSLCGRRLLVTPGPWPARCTPRCC